MSAQGEEGIGTKLKNVGELTPLIAPLGVAKPREQSIGSLTPHSGPHSGKITPEFPEMSN